MFRKLIALVTVALVLAACGQSEPDVLPEEPATVDELDAAVHSAALALLSGDTLPVAVIFFGLEDREEIVRYDWVDYRSETEEILAVTRHLDRTETVALSLTQGEWAEARISDAESYNWRAAMDLGAVSDETWVLARLLDMTTQETREVTEHDAGLAVTVTRQGATDGSELWTLVIPEDSESVRANHQWIINPDGVLQFYRQYQETTPLDGGVGAMVFEFGVENDDPEPIFVPELGTPLLLSDMGIPPALLDIEE